MALENLFEKILIFWIRREELLPKRLCAPAGLHAVTSRNAAMFTDTARKILTALEGHPQTSLQFPLLGFVSCVCLALTPQNYKREVQSVPVTLREHKKFLVSKTKLWSLRGSVLWRLQLSNLASHVAVWRHGGHKMLSNFIHVTLQPNKGSTRQTMVIATQWPDRYTVVFSLKLCSLQ
jgi:hypothetical protein